MLFPSGRADVRRSHIQRTRACSAVIVALCLTLGSTHACADNHDAPAQPIPLANARHDGQHLPGTTPPRQPQQHFPFVEMLKPVPPGQPRRDLDPMELILGPDSRTRSLDQGALQPLAATATCEELYNRVTVLLDQAGYTRPGVFDDPATSLFAALGTIARPAYLLVGVAALAKLAEERHVQTVEQRIEALRRRLAYKRCFVD